MPSDVVKQVYSKKLKKFVNSLTNDINDETPWQRIE